MLVKDKCKQKLLCHEFLVQRAFSTYRSGGGQGQNRTLNNGHAPQIVLSLMCCAVLGMIDMMWRNVMQQQWHQQHTRNDSSMHATAAFAGGQQNVPQLLHSQMFSESSWRHRGAYLNRLWRKGDWGPSDIA